MTDKRIDALFEVPNLDDLTIDTDDMAIVSEVLSILSRYARFKYNAMRARKSGAIALALEWERKMQDLYEQQLPPEYRW